MSKVKVTREERLKFINELMLNNDYIEFKKSFKKMYFIGLAIVLLTIGLSFLSMCIPADLAGYSLFELLGGFDSKYGIQVIAMLLFVVIILIDLVCKLLIDLHIAKEPLNWVLSTKISFARLIIGIILNTIFIVIFGNLVKTYGFDITLFCVVSIVGNLVEKAYTIYVRGKCYNFIRHYVLSMENREEEVDAVLKKFLVCNLSFSRARVGVTCFAIWLLIVFVAPVIILPKYGGEAVLDFGAAANQSVNKEPEWVRYSGVEISTRTEKKEKSLVIFYKDRIERLKQKMLYLKPEGSSQKDIEKYAEKLAEYTEKIKKCQDFIEENSNQIIILTYKDFTIDTYQYEGTAKNYLTHISYNADVKNNNKEVENISFEKDAYDYFKQGSYLVNVNYEDGSYRKYYLYKGDYDYNSTTHTFTWSDDWGSYSVIKNI